MSIVSCCNIAKLISSRWLQLHCNHFLPTQNGMQMQKYTICKFLDAWHWCKPYSWLHFLRFSSFLIKIIFILWDHLHSLVSSSFLGCLPILRAPSVFEVILSLYFFSVLRLYSFLGVKFRLRLYECLHPGIRHYFKHPTHINL